MKEVSPDNDTLKSSVFHRLLQRAFPEWFPYDSIRFFHPFYTSEQNAEFAKKQGYDSTFKMAANNPIPAASQRKWNVEGSEPRKPHKPLLLTRYDEIKAVLSTGADEILHPAFTDRSNLPTKVAMALSSIKAKSKKTTNNCCPADATITKEHFAQQMRAIVEREVITVYKNKANSTFQVDITRKYDLSQFCDRVVLTLNSVAIPVITRCFADFLGFGDQVKNIDNPKAKYSENEIYQHITNCQMFLAYNADETKLLKRRIAFKKSMAFLLKLAEEGNIQEASRYTLSRTLRSLFKRKPHSRSDLALDFMRVLGRSVADTILDEERDSGKAAAILLLTALDVAYISVLAVSHGLPLHLRTILTNI